LLDVLGSLNRALDDKLPNIDQNVWHAYIRVTGYAAFTRLTVRLKTTVPVVMGWDKMVVSTKSNGRFAGWWLAIQPQPAGLEALLITNWTHQRTSDQR